MRASSWFHSFLARVRERWRRRLKIYLSILGVLLLLGLAAIWTCRRPLFQGNLGTVEPGRVYRFAQPQPEDWPRLVAELQPASVLNLRGGSVADPWYVAEIDMRRQGMDIHELPMSATVRPSAAELLGLLDLFDHCRYPLLIHCKSGADRTGLASGLYAMYRQNVPPEQARRALTLAHGHVPLGGPEHMHEPFVEYQRWLSDGHLEHTPERLRDWIAHQYRDLNPRHRLGGVPARPGTF